MIFLFDFCSIHWLLPWLLPFLLGLLLGWLLWGRFKKIVEEQENEIANLKAKIGDLEADLANCRSARSDLESEIALHKGRIRELEASGKLNVTGSKVISVGGGDTNIDSTDDGDVSSKLVDEKDAATDTISAAAGAVASGVIGTKGAYGISYDKFQGLSNENLQIVEGVGPKMESLLKDNGIRNWSALADKSKGDLNAVLGKYGDKYRIIDPSNWSKQASLARDNKWDDLITLQRSLGTRGKKSKTGATDAKVEKLLVKLGILKKWKQDDLKAVEGVGPKIEKLLHNAGIKTWRELSNSSVSKIQEVLSEAGDRFRLADPATWPQQAGLAADGDWDALEELQDKLTGGRK